MPKSNPPPDFIKNGGFVVVAIIYFLEQVYDNISLTEVVLNIVVEGFISEFDKLVLKSSALFKQTMNTTANLHYFRSVALLFFILYYSSTSGKYFLHRVKKIQARGIDTCHIPESIKANNVPVTNAIFFPSFDILCQPTEVCHKKIIFFIVVLLLKS